MNRHIPAPLRREVYARDQGICEYCLIHESDTSFGCEIEHIISQKHGGKTILRNSALSCVYCNRFKGSDIGQATAMLLCFNTDDRLLERETLIRDGRFPSAQARDRMTRQA
jgi:5-methylcytosine-specific restriction endonuclease McrA